MLEAPKSGVAKMTMISSFHKSVYALHRTLPTGSHGLGGNGGCGVAGAGAVLRGLVES